MQRKYKIFLIFLTLLLILYGSLRFLLPFLVKPQIESLLSEQTTTEIKIETLTFEPLSLEIELSNILLNQKQLAQNIYSNISLNEIFNKKIVISHLSLKGLNFEVIKEKRNFKLKGLKRANQSETPHPKGESLSWDLTLETIDISNVNIKFPGPKDIVIRDLHIKDLHSYSSEEKTNFRGNFFIGDSQISLNGSANNYYTHPTVRSQIKVDEMDLGFINIFPLDVFGKIEGQFSTNSKIQLEDGKWEVESNLSLKNFALYSKNLKTVEYYIKKLDMNKGYLSAQGKDISTNIDLLKTENLILSMPADILETKKHLSKFAKIKLSDIKYEQRLGPKGLLFNFQALYNNESPIKARQKFKGGKKELNINIRGMNLVPFSETLEQSLGHQIESGKLNLKLRTRTENKNVTGKLTAKLDQFHLDNQSERGRDISSDSAIPLKTAVSMIRDDQGSVEFELDISGSEENPDFGFLPIIKSGIGSFLVSKLTTTIATRAASELLPLLVSSIPFSPANAFILARGSYKFVTKPRFKDIEFTPHEDEITGESKELVKRLKDFLKENDNMRFQLCPIASTHESAKDTQSPTLSETQALDLANDRIEKVKTLLKEKKIESSQIIFCRPKVSSEMVAKGQLEISL